MPEFQQVNKTNTTMKVHHHSPAEWQTLNEVLAQGEYGLEDGTFLLKIGDGVTHWNDLRYLNKLDASYFKYYSDGTVTFSNAFQAILNNFIERNNAIVPSLVITGTPSADNEAVTKAYVDQVISSVSVLRHVLVYSLPDPSEADENTVYMLQNQSGTYDEWLLVDGVFVQMSTTTFELQPANLTTLGGVKSSQEDDKIYVNLQGYMQLNRVSTSKLFIRNGDTLTLNCGDSQEV